MNQRRFRPNTEVVLRRSPEWTGCVVRSAGDMTLVAWTTGTLAGETKWTDTAGLDAVKEPVTADVVNPARIVSAVANDNHTVDAIAAYLGVNHSNALLRTTLTQMVGDGQLDADDSETRRFTLPWE